MSAPYPNLRVGSLGRHRPHHDTTLEILSALAGVGRATAVKIAEDIDRNEWGVRKRLKLLLERELVEEAGRLPRYPGHTRGRGPMTYRLHARLRQY